MRSAEDGNATRREIGGGEGRGFTRKMRHANHRDLCGISKSIYIYVQKMMVCTYMVRRVSLTRCDVPRAPARAARFSPAMSVREQYSLIHKLDRLIGSKSKRWTANCDKEEKEGGRGGGGRKTLEIESCGEDGSSQVGQAFSMVDRQITKNTSEARNNYTSPLG